MSIVALLLGCFFFVALWELYRPRRELASAAGPRWMGNLAVYFINGVLVVWLFPAPSAAAAHFETILGVGFLKWPQPVSVVNFVIGFLLLDFSRYWMHRL